MRTTCYFLPPPLLLFDKHNVKYEKKEEKGWEVLKNWGTVEK